VAGGKRLRLSHDGFSARSATTTPSKRRTAPVGSLMGLDLRDGASISALPHSASARQPAEGPPRLQEQQSLARRQTLHLTPFHVNPPA